MPALATRVVALLQRHAERTRHSAAWLFLWSTVSVGAAAPTGIERVAWMAGCWTLTTNGRTVDEQWMAPRGGAMLGVSRTVKDGRLTEYELVVLRERGDALVFLAHPSGQAAGEFTATHVEDAGVVFENTQHDFPQRIGYRRRGDHLDAWIEGVVGGEVRRVAFPYRRVHCPGR